MGFQSTPSTRRETGCLCSCTYSFIISIHSLHTEGDQPVDLVHNTLHHFNPLPPHGGRPWDVAWDVLKLIISIHSLHTEGDLFQVPPMPEPLNFNPLPPHGGRLHQIPPLAVRSTFQSTPSTRRETGGWLKEVRHSLFQSTPSTRRETDLTLLFMMRRFLFQSTPSTRRETEY